MKRISLFAGGALALFAVTASAVDHQVIARNGPRVFDPATHRWREWRLPGHDPHAYAIFVDERDIVWLSEWSANALARFDPRSGKFDVLALPRAHASVRQMMAPAGGSLVVRIGHGSSAALSVSGRIR